jgi:hypothetical protein
MAMLGICGRHSRMTSAIAVADVLRVLACHQQQAAEALARQLRVSSTACETGIVTRGMGLLREKPQYLQMLMHSLLR